MINNRTSEETTLCNLPTYTATWIYFHKIGQVLPDIENAVGAIVRIGQISSAVTEVRIHKITLRTKTPQLCITIRNVCSNNRNIAVRSNGRLTCCQLCPHLVAG